MPFRIGKHETFPTPISVGRMTVHRFCPAPVLAPQSCNRKLDKTSTPVRWRLCMQDNTPTPTFLPGHSVAAIRLGSKWRTVTRLGLSAAAWCFRGLECLRSSRFTTFRWLLWQEWPSRSVHNRYYHRENEKGNKWRKCCTRKRWMGATQPL